MKHFSFSTLALAGVLSASAGQALANPETAVDFAVSTSFFQITSNSQTSPNILLTVTATCPENGFLVATGAMDFQPLSGFVGSTNASVEYGISKNSFAMDPGNSYELRARVGTGGIAAGDHVNIPVSHVRTDFCSQGQSVTYRLAARKVSADAVTAAKPRMVVTFYKDVM